ncbi:intradiol ring-cleavage dioxygenase [Methylobacterium sp. GXF4]|uniref:dioxygenase family protein n=1 Tax=Methylobacterium sp. GXF4 TaxID=1096546 RepID=UPI000269A5B3|nr:intradiol ring-cleavage dioxygenase [Methylobacterium sp. GXF4]EIZ86840.1 intradiol ring-cleavage dioxygenase [Methylobacterium sp. GXF4]
MNDSPKPIAGINRRRAFGTALTAPLTLAGALPAVAASAATPVPQHCVLTPQAVEGPFYFDPHLERSNVTEGHPGVPLVIRVTVLEAGPCTPLAGARVDIWSAGADGEYSGYTGGPGGSRTEGAFLRGTQMTDQAGLVVFRTIYPSWYPGRTPHIHFKVFLDGRNVLMGQIYLPDALSEYLFENVSAYRGRSRSRDTFNSTDMLARMDPGRIAFCDIREAADHYAATLVVGVDRQGVVMSGGPDGAPPGSTPPGAFGRRPPPGPPEFRRLSEPALIVPGVSLADQQSAGTRR